MNGKIQRVAAVVGALALAAAFFVPWAQSHGRAAVPASAGTVATIPSYGDRVVATTDTGPAPTAPQYNGNYPPQFWNYMYGMMGYMMGPYWGNPGASGNGPGGYPYYGMMGGWWGYPGQGNGQYAPPWAVPYNNGGSGGVSGNVYGQ